MKTKMIIIIKSSKDAFFVCEKVRVRNRKYIVAANSNFEIQQYRTKLHHVVDL